MRWRKTKEQYYTITNFRKNAFKLFRRASRGKKLITVRIKNGNKPDTSVQLLPGGKYLSLVNQIDVLQKKLLKAQKELLNE